MSIVNSVGVTCFVEISIKKTGTKPKILECAVFGLSTLVSLRFTPTELKL